MNNYLESKDTIFWDNYQTNVDSTLDVSDNRISDMSPLKNMTYLKYLDVDSNQITGMSSFEDMTSLQNTHNKFCFTIYPSHLRLFALSLKHVLQYIVLVPHHSPELYPIRHGFP